MCYSTNILYPMDCAIHKYCLACIKGLCFSTSPSTNGKVQCPTCRHVAGPSYIRAICESPNKIQPIDLDSITEGLLRGREFLWIYEGRNNGWWYYDKDIQDALEVAHGEGRHQLEWIICGQPVFIDFGDMIQLNEDNSAVRHVERVPRSQLHLYLIKGIAGMR